jgi:hypothetical protein
MALFHLGLFLGPNRPGPLEVAIDVSAIVLPPLGACFIALRASFENQRLRRTYDLHARELDKFDGELGDLLLQLKQVPLGADCEPLSQTFAHLVIEVEAILGSELISWRLILEPENPAG